MALLEHKIKKATENRVLQKIAPGWNYEHSDKERIWPMRDPQVVECEVGNKSDRYI